MATIGGVSTPARSAESSEKEIKYIRTALFWPARCLKGVLEGNQEGCLPIVRVQVLLPVRAFLGRSHGLRGQPVAGQW